MNLGSKGSGCAGEGSEKLPDVLPPALPDQHPEALPLRDLFLLLGGWGHSAVSSVTSLTSENVAGLYSRHSQGSPDDPRHC